MAVQTSFEVRPPVGFVGDLARPGEPHAFDYGYLHVPASGRKARPGDAVIWDETQNQYKVPVTAAEELLVVGIVSYEASAIPNSSGVIEYDDNEAIKVCVLGTVFVTAGGNTEYHHLLRFQEDDFKWDAGNPTSYAETYHRAVECVTMSGTDGDVIEARIGYGRTN